MEKQTKVLCPECGSEFFTPENQFTTVATVGKDSAMGFKDEEKNNQKKSKQSLPALQRIEALRKAGADVSNLFAMHGACGGDFIAAV